jgi:hypothetical protein
LNTSFALAVNNSGQVVGEVQTAAEGNSGANTSATNDTYLYNMTTHAVTYLSDSGLRFAYQTASTIGAGFGNLINQQSQVVGEEQVGPVWHAAIWDAGNGLRDLNALYGPSGANILPSGFVLNAATAINDSGYIVGYGTDSAGNTNQMFLLSAPTLPGDANLDGRVDINDLTIVLAHYGESGMSWATGEFTGDGTVDINDLTIVLANYGRTLGAASLAAVPEPSALVLIAVGVVSLVACARRRRR